MECVCAVNIIWVHLCVVRDGVLDHGQYKRNSGEQ